MKQIFLLSLLSLSFTTLAERTPEEKKALFETATLKLKESGIEKKVPQVGETFPNLKLGEKTVSEWVKSGKLVVSFYRGGWCPYCVQQLKEISAGIRDLEKDGAHLIAISPETKEEVRKTAEKNNLNFLMLSDADNKLGKKLNLVFRVQDDVNQEYKGFGIDLEKSQGNKSHELPMPATFVIDQNQKVIYMFADADYKKRASLSDVLQALKK